MSRFLICTVPVIGHINPGLPIARKLIERGHAVWWYTGRKFRAAIEATGARFLPMAAALDYDAEQLDAAYPGRQGLTGLAQMKWDLKHIFVDAIPIQAAELRRILREYPADVVLTDPGFYGAGVLSAASDPPYATYGISALTLASRDTAPFGTALPPDSSRLGRLRNRALAALFQQLLFRDVNDYADQVRAAAGLPPLTGSILDAFSPYLYLQSSTPAFEYPRSDLPPQVHFIGPLLPAPPAGFVAPPWWGELRQGKPVVLVNQGTVATRADDLIVPTLRALAEQDLLVIATTGGAPIDRLGIDVPPNARVESFVPFAALMPHLSLVITNGGYGGVQFALAHGVPLIVAGATEEKPEIAARVAWSGAGINLKSKTPAPEQIRAAVDAVLGNPAFLQAARRIQADYAAHDAAHEAATLLEQLARTRRLVSRGQLAAHVVHEPAMATSGTAPSG